MSSVSPLHTPRDNYYCHVGPANHRHHRLWSDLLFSSSVRDVVLGFDRSVVVA